MPSNYEIARKYLPDKGAKSFRWRIDRALVAKKKPFSEWKKNTAVADWGGYDSPSRMPLPTKRDTWKRIHHTPSSGEAAMLEEPERFVREGQFSRQLLESIKDDFYDFESFKLALRRAFKSDRGGLSEMIDNIDHVGKDKGYEALFNTRIVQDWLKENTLAGSIAWLSERFKLNHQRAKQVFERLSEKNKYKVIEASMTGKRIRLKKIPRKLKDSFVPTTPRIKQISRKGNPYHRTKPVRYTKHEITFLRNNARKMSTVKLANLHHRIFKKTPRTLISLRTKIARMGIRKRK